MAAKGAEVKEEPGTSEDNAAQQEREKANAQVCALIVSSLSPSDASTMDMLESAHDIFHSLCGKYEPKSSVA